MDWSLVNHSITDGYWRRKGSRVASLLSTVTWCVKKGCGQR